MKAIQQSHGKPHVQMPRSRNLPDQGAAIVRSGNRDAAGRFVPNNTVGYGRGWKAAVGKLLGKAVEDRIASAVGRNAWVTYNAILRELPSDGPLVRSLAAQHAQHVALTAFWNAQAFERGLATAEGIQAQELSMRHGQRAERLLVTMLDVAPKMADAERKRQDAARWAQPARQDEPDDADDRQDQGDDEEPAESIVERSEADAEPIGKSTFQSPPEPAPAPAPAPGSYAEFAAKAAAHAAWVASQQQRRR